MTRTILKLVSWDLLNFSKKDQKLTVQVYFANGDKMTVECSVETDCDFMDSGNRLAFNFKLTVEGFDDRSAYLESLTDETTKMSDVEEAYGIFYRQMEKIAEQFIRLPRKTVTIKIANVYAHHLNEWIDYLKEEMNKLVESKDGVGIYEDNFEDLGSDTGSVKVEVSEQEINLPAPVLEEEEEEEEEHES